MAFSNRTNQEEFVVLLLTAMKILVENRSEKIRQNFPVEDWEGELLTFWIDPELFEFFLTWSKDRKISVQVLLSSVVTQQSRWFYWHCSENGLLPERAPDTAEEIFNAQVQGDKAFKRKLQ